MDMPVDGLSQRIEVVTLCRRNTRRGGATVDEDTLDEIRAARQELDDVIDEIRTVSGFEGFLAQPTFADVADAAGREPLVYLAAAELGGLALVVRGDDVEHIDLDGLTAAAVHDRVARYFAVYDAFRGTGSRDDGVLLAWRAALDDVTGWLWTDVMGPVIDAVRPAPAVVLIAGGLLGLLPLHAAWTTEPSDNGPPTRKYALDELTITYAPNARSLAAARALATRPADRVLAVAVPEEVLASAPAEAIVAGSSFPTATTVVPAGADGPRTVANQMREVDVVHFACHGYADVTSPLDSALDLDGRPLTLRQIFAMNLQLRLAVLPACETSVPGTDLPDEVVALPTGLLQAGVGGIVASLWRIDDLATLILMIEFYRRWRREGADPPAALRQAQRWLRDASNGSIVDAYESALRAGAAWLPPAAAVAVLGVLKFRPAHELGFATVDAWAGLAYIGA
jgi:hypothetical protein